MRVRITFNFSAEDRRNLADEMGHAEPLDRDDLEQWALKVIRSTLETIEPRPDVGGGS